MRESNSVLLFWKESARSPAAHHFSSSTRFRSEILPVFPFCVSSRSDSSTAFFFFLARKFFFVVMEKQRVCFLPQPLCRKISYKVRVFRGVFSLQGDIFRLPRAITVRQPLFEVVNCAWNSDRRKHLRPLRRSPCADLGVPIIPAGQASCRTSFSPRIFCNSRSSTCTSFAWPLVVRALRRDSSACLIASSVPLSSPSGMRISSSIFFRCVRYAFSRCMYSA